MAPGTKRMLSFQKHSPKSSRSYRKREKTSSGIPRIRENTMPKLKSCLSNSSAENKRLKVMMMKIPIKKNKNRSQRNQASFSVSKKTKVTMAKAWKSLLIDEARKSGLPQLRFLICTIKSTRSAMRCIRSLAIQNAISLRLHPTLRNGSRWPTESFGWRLNLMQWSTKIRKTLPWSHPWWATTVRTNTWSRLLAQSSRNKSNEHAKTKHLLHFPKY